MTASLDRAVEAAAHAFLETVASHQKEMEVDLVALRAALLAALPHLVVDREALRGLAEKWRHQEPTCGALASQNRKDAFRRCANDLLHLIETNQE